MELVFQIAFAVFSLLSAFLSGFLVCMVKSMSRHELAPETAKKDEEQEDKLSVEAQFMNMMRYTGEKQHDD